MNSVQRKIREGWKEGEMRVGETEGKQALLKQVLHNDAHYTYPKYFSCNYSRCAQSV